MVKPQHPTAAAAAASVGLAAAVLLALAGVAAAGTGEFGQDDWVLQLFPDRKGYYIDVGAWHTELASNSKSLEDAGWSGICIEPFGSGFDQRTCAFEPVVLSDYPGQLLKFQVAGPFGGVRSTMSEAHWNTFKEEFQKGHVRVKASTTLGEVLKRNSAPQFIEYLSIDVEGHEVQVLKGIPFWRYTFGAITVDHDKDPAKQACITSLLNYHGYSLAQEMGQDLAFVRNATQTRPENINC